MQDLKTKAINYFGIAAISTLILVVFLDAWGLWCLRGYFVRESGAVAALETYGFKDISIQKRDVSFVRLRGGGKEDVVRFTAAGINPAGNHVSIEVFSGWPFKGATVRSTK